MSYKITAEPSVEPLTLTEAKAHLRVDFTDDDTYIDTIIKSARKVCEKYCNIVFITQTWRQNENNFGAYIDLSVSPVQSVTTIKYYDTAEVQQTLATANYQVDTLSDTGAIYEGVTLGFPSISSNTINPIEVIYVCGYGLAVSVPEDIKAAILLMISHLYENREPVNIGLGYGQQIPMPKAVRDILTPYRVKRFG